MSEKIIPLKRRMLDLFKKTAPGFLKSNLIKMGNFLNSGEGFPSQNAAFRTLRDLGWSPEYVIDVGAFKGAWAQNLKKTFPRAKVLMIEGQDSLETELENVCQNSNKELQFQIALLGAEDGKEVTFTEMETGSSVFEENSRYDRKQKVRKLHRLDTVLQDFPPFQKPAFLKLDTQGYELEVLKGAPELLKKVEAVLMETSLVASNQGAPLFHEVCEFMAANNFRLFDFCSQIRRIDGILWQTDLLWIAENSSIKIDTHLDAENWQ